MAENLEAVFCRYNKLYRQLVALYIDSVKRCKSDNEKIGQARIFCGNIVKTRKRHESDFKHPTLGPMLYGLVAKVLMDVMRFDRENGGYFMSVLSSFDYYYLFAFFGEDGHRDE